MGVLDRSELVKRYGKKQLLRNGLEEKGLLSVEFASYDLRAGIAVWKDSKTNEVRRCEFDPNSDGTKQKTVTLQPGQMMFVITYEEIIMPKDLCGTVFSRNSLALNGILALNAGHIDPGFEGPIVIRLINLKGTAYTLTLGSQIYTIVYQTLQNEAIDGHRAISRSETLQKVYKAADEALSNALHDIALSYEFLKITDFDKRFADELKKYRNRILKFVIAFLIGILTVGAAIVKILEWVQTTSH